MNKFTKFIVAAALTAFASTASATILSGNIDFDGGFAGYEADGVTEADNSVATIFKFVNDVTITAADGTLSPLLGTNVTYTDLNLSAFSPITPFWISVLDSSIKFDLETITVDVVVFGTRIVQGKGTLFADDHGVTHTAEYNWKFSSQGDGSGANPTIFSFSASQAKVPEPALALLLATGLIGFGVARRVRKAA